MDNLIKEKQIISTNKIDSKKSQEVYTQEKELSVPININTAKIDKDTLIYGPEIPPFRVPLTFKYI